VLLPDPEPQAEELTNQNMLRILLGKAKDEVCCYVISKYRYRMRICGFQLCMLKCNCIFLIIDYFYVGISLQDVNTLVRKCLGYRPTGDGGWDNAICFPKWREKFPDPPDFIGLANEFGVRDFSKEVKEIYIRSHHMHKARVVRVSL